MESEADEASLHSPDWSNLPQELMTAILVRFPVKFLLQLKCVSKDWLRLISSPYFVKAHLHVSSKDYRLLLYNSVEPQFKHYSVTSLFDEQCSNPFYLDRPVENLDNRFCIVGSVNGLICFRNGLKGDFFLWNPSTRKIQKVPLPIDESENFGYGFGYDELRDDYKVVGITECNSLVCGGQIYSLKSDSWRELDFQGGVKRYNWAKLVNGRLHWVTRARFCEDRIISFDLVDEKFGEVVQPSYEEGIMMLSLGVLGSDLSMLCNHLITSPLAITQSDLWVMKEYGVKESWTKLYTIIYPDDGRFSLSSSPFVSSPPVCMSSKGESWFNDGVTLRIYNPDDKSFTDVADVYGHDKYGHLQAQLYIESLVCPFSQNEPMSQH